MSDKEIEQELQNALQPGHKRTPKLLISVRLLGLSERRGSMNEDYYVPKELLEQLSFGKAMYADFTICPLTDDEPRVMRLACVESAENISIRDWP